MAFSATLTRNRASVQIILPAELRNRYGLLPGGSVELEPKKDGIFLRLSVNSPTVSFAVTTVGYEGTSIDRFLEELMTAGVRQILDVREFPLSRKNGFSKEALAAALKERGIFYRHIPELGSPRELRHAYKNGGSPTKFMEGYSRHLDRNPDSYQLMRGLALGLPSAIMCFERDHRTCHREILSERLTGEGFRVTHL